MWSQKGSYPVGLHLFYLTAALLSQVHLPRVLAEPHNTLLALAACASPIQTLVRLACVAAAAHNFSFNTLIRHVTKRVHPLIPLQESNVTHKGRTTACTLHIFVSKFCCLELSSMVYTLQVHIDAEPLHLCAFLACCIFVQSLRSSPQTIVRTNFI